MKIAFTDISNTNTIKSAVSHVFLREKTAIQIPAFKGISSDTFEHNSNIYEKALSKINDFTKEEYDSLTEEEKIALRESIVGKSNISAPLINANEDVKMHQYAAEAIRHVLDEQYGKDKYVVIAIGRSLSSISKLLEMKIGKENAKNIPMSAMNRFYLHTNNLDCYEKKIDQFSSMEGFDNFKQYLDSIGLSKEKVNKSGKNYVIMDYTSSGMSLKAAYTILTSDKLLGNEKRNITTASMGEITSAIKLDKTPLGSLDQKLDRSFYKKYSTIERMFNGYNDIEYMTDYKLRNKNYPNNNFIKQIKLFGFALLDSEYSDTEKTWEKITLKKRKVEKNKNIWLAPYAQYQKDIEEDSQFLYQLQSRVDKNFKSLKEAESKYKRKKTDELYEFCKKLKQNFETKYPLEYKYYKNQKEFEKLEDSLFKNDRAIYGAIIFKEIKGFEKNSPLYNLFEETEEFEKSIFDENSNVELESARKLKKVNHLLFLMGNNIKRFIIEDEIYPDKSLQEEYYQNFRPSFLRLLNVVSKNFTQEFCETFCNNIDAIYHRAIMNVLKNGVVKCEEIKKKTQNIQITHSKEKLAEIVKAQNSALESAKVDMLPF